MGPENLSLPTGPRRTRVVAVDPERLDRDLIGEAAACLRRGGLVVFPTETVYGLGADATNGRAVSGIFAAKGRPSDNPLIVHVASPEDVASLVTRIDSRAEVLMRTFWPGPLSLVLLRSPRVAPEVSCGLDTVAVRMPRHPVALELIRLAGVPVAAPSANTSGRPSPTRVQDVLADLDGRVDYVLDAGPCPVGVESTVLDLTGPVPTVLRPGGVTLEELRRVIGRVEFAPGTSEAAAGPASASPAEPASQRSSEPVAGPPLAARSPGLRHRHYAPRARLVLVPPVPPAGAGTDGRGGAPVGPEAALAEAVAAEVRAGRKVGVACTRESAQALAGMGLGAGPGGSADEPGGARAQRGGVVAVVAWGGRERPEEVAAGLFATLRDLDAMGVDVIVAEGAKPEGLGVAINDRLGRAAAGAGKEAEPPTARPELILLVCSGNTCRSPMAAAILSDLLRREGLGAVYQVDSAGLAAVPGQPASPEARRVMSERGLSLEEHRSKPVTADLVSAAKLVLTMTRQHKDAVIGLYPEATDRVYTLKGFAGKGHARGGAGGSGREAREAGEARDVRDVRDVRDATLAGPGKEQTGAADGEGAADRTGGAAGSAAADRTGGAAGSAAADDEDIADPIGRGVEAYRLAADEITAAARGVIERLRSLPDLDRLFFGEDDKR